MMKAAFLCYHGVYNYLQCARPSRHKKEAYMPDAQAFINKLPIVFERLVFAAILVAVTVFLLWFFGKIYRKYTRTERGLIKERRTWASVLYSFIRFLIVVVAILILLNIFGVNITGAIAGLGIAAAAAALAVQDLLKDLIMGITIITDKFFAVGDVVEYNGVTGRIISITMRSTKMEILSDQSTLTIQNHNISEIKVLSHRTNILVPLPYDLPAEKAEKILQTIAERSCTLDFVEDCSFMGTQSFDDSSVSYMLALYCDPYIIPDTRRSILRIIQEELEKAHVEIPFRQLDIHSK